MLFVGDDWAEAITTSRSKSTRAGCWSGVGSPRV